MRTERWYLGVDGGGTKTAAALVDTHGRVRATAVGPASLRTELGWSGAVRSVARTVRSLRQRARVRGTIEATCFALAGIDAPHDATVARRHLDRAFGTRVGRIIVRNDTEAALRAGTTAPHAAVVVCGTGSNALARGPRGTMLAGGWGRLLGDDGSGFWIARAGLRASLRSLDGRGPATALWPALARAAGARDLQGLHDRLVAENYDKRTVSLLARTVDRLSQRDAVARSIVHAAGIELAAMAEAACRRAGLGRTAFPLVVSGGCFEAPVLLRAFRASVRHTLPHARVTRPRVLPAAGAALLAKELA